MLWFFVALIVVVTLWANSPDPPEPWWRTELRELKRLERERRNERAINKEDLRYLKRHPLRGVSPIRSGVAKRVIL